MTTETVPEVLDLRALPPGRRLRLRRELLGLSQDDVARHLGVVRPRVTEAEMGHNPGLLPRLAAALDELTTGCRAAGAT